MSVSNSGYAVGRATLLSPVRLVQTTNLTGNYVNGTRGVGAQFIAASAGALTVDGSAVMINDSVALIGQTVASQNGIYVVTNTGSTAANYVLTRRDDTHTAAQYIPGLFCAVGDGTANAGSFLILKAPAPGVVDQDAISYVKK